MIYAKRKISGQFQKHRAELLHWGDGFVQTGVQVLQKWFFGKYKNIFPLSSFSFRKVIFIYVSDEVDWGKTRLLPRVDEMLISVAKIANFCPILYKINHFWNVFCISGENRRPVFCGGSLSFQRSSLTASTGEDRLVQCKFLFVITWDQAKDLICDHMGPSKRFVITRDQAEGITWHQAWLANKLL